jgi:hypothetical protein
MVTFCFLRRLVKVIFLPAMKTMLPTSTDCFPGEATLHVCGVVYREAKVLMMLLTMSVIH